RRFNPAALFDLGGPWKRNIILLALLPANYFLEIVFFAAVAWRRFRALRTRPLERWELALWVMLVSSVLLTTFVRSSVIQNNDLPWRGMLLAQFVLLLWGIDVVPSVKKSAFVAILLLYGVAGTGYSILLLRFYIPLMGAN